MLCAVKVTGILELGEDGLNDGLMAFVGRANEVVDAQIEGVWKFTPFDGQLIAVGLRGLTLGTGGLLDLLTVFVEAGEEEDLVTERLLGSGEHIGHDLFVGMAQVGLAVEVINCGCEIEFFRHRWRDLGVFDEEWQGSGRDAMGESGSEVAVS